MYLHLDPDISDLINKAIHSNASLYHKAAVDLSVFVSVMTKVFYSDEYIYK